MMKISKELYKALHIVVPVYHTPKIRQNFAFLAPLSFVPPYSVGILNQLINLIIYLFETKQFY